MVIVYGTGSNLRTLIRTSRSSGERLPGHIDFFTQSYQGQQQETTRASRLEIKLIRMREAHTARLREIIKLIQERDWLRQFSTQFLSTLIGNLSMGLMLGWRPGQDVPVVSTTRQGQIFVGLPSNSGFIIKNFINLGTSCLSRKILGSQSPNHVEEATFENSINRQSKPVIEVTPTPIQNKLRMEKLRILWPK